MLFECLKQNKCQRIFLYGNRIEVEMPQKVLVLNVHFSEALQCTHSYKVSRTY